MRTTALLLAFWSVTARAPPPEPNVDVGVRLPEVVRTETTNSSRKAVEVRDLLGERFDVATLPPGTPLTLWVERGRGRNKLVGFRILVDGHPFTGLLARLNDPGVCGQGCDVFVDDDGVTLAGTTLASPVDAWTISSRVGVRDHPLTHRRRFHAGTDYAAPIGTPVLSVQEGTVSLATRSWTAGRFVVVRHDDGSEAKYLHLDERSVVEKQRVRRGDLIGVVGQTGRVTGPHLHFELRDRLRCPVDMTVARWPGRARIDDDEARLLTLRRRLLDQQTSSWPATLEPLRPARRSSVDAADLIALFRARGGATASRGSRLLGSRRRPGYGCRELRL